MILNNIFHFRLCKTVSIATTTPLKHIPVFDIQSSFDIQAVSRRKQDQKNQQYFKTWKEWTTARQVCFLPAEPMHMALYLLSKVQAGHTFPTIDASFYAIKFFHKSLLNVDPCSHFFLSNMFEAAKRVAAHKIKKKKALSLNDMDKFFVKLNQNKTLCGFVRFSEVSRLRRSEFIFSSTYVKIFIEKSKREIYREGMWVYISASSKICPLKQLKYYLTL